MDHKVIKQVQNDILRRYSLLTQSSKLNIEYSLCKLSLSN